jgi:hypothetical protein
MNRKHGVLVLVAVVSLMAAGGLTRTLTSQPASLVSQSEALAVPSVDVVPSGACEADASFATSEGAWSEVVKPGCCSTNCNVDKDCDRICGKGVCACIQESPCCRRCTY